MAEINELFITAANNTALFPEGLAASGYNDSARELLAMIARWDKDTSATLISSGSAIAYTVTTNRVFAAYASGACVRVKFHVACNATPTFKIGALLAKPLVRQTGTAIVAGDIQANMIADVAYDAANDRFVVLGLDDREKAAVLTVATLPAAAVANAGIFYLVSDPPGGNAEGAVAYDTGSGRIAYLRERAPTFTSAAGATQRPASAVGTSGKVSLRTDHAQGTVLSYDTGAGWKDVDDILDILATVNLPTPTTAMKGWTVFDDTTDSLVLCTGTAWKKFPTFLPTLVGPQLPTYTVLTLADVSPATNARVMVYVSNASGGATVAFSDGNNWLRVQDRAVVS